MTDNLFKSEKYGTDWTDAELDKIIVDYFSMLTKDLGGSKYVKSHHNSSLMALIGRSHRSIEFKHQNISAVLEELGLPWIPGYKPKRNYQNAIFEGIDRYLSRNHALLKLTPTPPSVVFSPDIFVSPPNAAAADRHLPPRFQRLIRKFDPVERDRKNRALGRAGEQFVLEVEKQRPCQGHRPDLAERIRWVSEIDGDGAGFDISSYDLDGRDTLIEVKTTNGWAGTPFYVTRTEHEVSLEQQMNWYIYRVHDFAESPRIFRLSSPLKNFIKLEPETWRASF